MAIPALLAASPYILQGMGLLGGIFGKKKRKYMDSEALRQMYGPQAVGKDTTELANYILNSPYGQQLMSSAAEQGQTFQTEMASRAAASGLSPDTGGQSGAGDFATSAAAGAQSGFERQTRAGMFEAAMPIAAQMSAARMQAALGQEQDQNMNAPLNLIGRIGSAAGQVAASIPARARPDTSSKLPTAALAGAANYVHEAPALRSAAPAASRTGYQSPWRTAMSGNVRSGSMRRGLTGGRR